MTSLWSTILRRSSSYECGRARSSRTARATSISTSSWNTLGSCRRQAAQHRCLTGNGRHGRGTSYPPTIRHETRCESLPLPSKEVEYGYQWWHHKDVRILAGYWGTWVVVTR